MVPWTTIGRMSSTFAHLRLPHTATSGVHDLMSAWLTSGAHGLISATLWVPQGAQ